jgi:AcrR family transcriptional regulator
VYVDVVAADRLDRDDWITAGLDALERGGLEAVAVVPLARSLGVTRGSFYWHFTSREELVEAILERWEREHGTDVLAAVAAIEDPRARLREILGRAVLKPPTYFARLLDAGGSDPLVAATLERVAAARLAVLAKAYRECGLTAPEARRSALIAYAAYAGLARLPQAGAGALSDRDRRALADRVTATFVP